VEVAEGEEGMILVPKTESYPYMWQRYGYVTATYVWVVVDSAGWVDFKIGGFKTVSF